MSYKLKCRLAGCSLTATHISPEGIPFCTKCANRASNIMYGKGLDDKPIIRLDMQELKLMAALAAALENNKDDPEAMACEAKRSIARYFDLKDQPIIASAVRRSLTWG